MDRDIEIRADQAAITPFWHKLPFFFTYPFRFGPLVLLVSLVLASGLAGLALGAFSLVFKGFLAYLGLRYAFNVLDLFAKGRFEGESPDHRLWGPEKRPAKFGTVLALFLALLVTLGNIALERRVESDPALQERVLDRYRAAHAEEMAQLAREREAFNRRIGLSEPARPAVAPVPSPQEDDEDAPSGGTVAPAAAADPAPAAVAPPEFPIPRAEILESWRPGFGDAAWLAWQPAWFWLVAVLLSLMLPSAAITIALEDDLPRALNPLNVAHLIGAMGSAYFVLWGFFLAIAGSRQVALRAGESLPAVLRFPLEMGLATYLGLVLFALMGYALYQFHQQLHLEVDVDFDDHRAAGGAEAIAAAGSARAAVARGSAPADPWEAKLQDLVTQGRHAEAIAEVRDRMRHDRFDVPLNARLHKLLRAQGDAQDVLAHGQQWLTALARAGNGSGLVDALRALMPLDPALQVQDGDVILPAATAAAQQRDFALATALLRGFDKRFPGHRDTPGVIFLGARLLSEQSRQHEKAVKLLRAVLHHFPDHAVAADAAVYLKVLEKVMASRPTAA